jgi:hypothetical protein
MKSFGREKLWLPFVKFRGVISSEAIRLAATILVSILPTLSRQIFEICQVQTIAWGKQLEWNNKYLTNRYFAAESSILFPPIA